MTKSVILNLYLLIFTGFRGENGPMNTRRIEKVPILQKLIEAGVEMGWQELEDYNGPQLEGIYIYLLKLEVYSRIYIPTSCW